jgi:hypothetical protein
MAEKLTAFMVQGVWLRTARPWKATFSWGRADVKVKEYGTNQEMLINLDHRGAISSWEPADVAVESD